jgi:hypothetical protein
MPARDVLRRPERAPWGHLASLARAGGRGAVVQHSKSATHVGVGSFAPNPSPGAGRLCPERSNPSIGGRRCTDNGHQLDRVSVAEVTPMSGVGASAVSRCSKLYRYSITSSARASSDGGTSRPSAVAVFRLITSSYLVGFCTGKSAVFSPFRMRLT